MVGISEHLRKIGVAETRVAEIDTEKRWASVRLKAKKKVLSEEKNRGEENHPREIGRKG